MSFQIGDIIAGEVTGIQPYGAFIALGNDEQGLIHISEVRHGYIKNIYDALKVGDGVEVMVIDIDEYTKKISLSMRALEESFSQLEISYKKRYFTSKYKHIGFAPLKKSLPKWIDATTAELKK